MKKNYFLILLLFFSFKAYTQDNLILKSGEELQVKVIEIGLADIIYKKFDNLTGPDYVVSKRDVFMIKYENGTKDVFGEKKVEAITTTTNPFIKKKLKYIGSGDYIVESNGLKIETYMSKMDTIFQDTKNPDIYKYFSSGRANYRSTKALGVFGFIATLAGGGLIGYGITAMNSHNDYNASIASGRTSSNGSYADASSYQVPLYGGIAATAIGLGTFIPSAIVLKIKDRKLRMAGDLYNQENRY